MKQSRTAPTTRISRKLSAMLTVFVTRLLTITVGTNTKAPNMPNPKSTLICVPVTSSELTGPFIECSSFIIYSNRSIGTTSPYPLLKISGI